MSQGDGDVRGPWNQGGDWDFVEDPEAAVDGGAGDAQVQLSAEDEALDTQLTERTMSNVEDDPITGAELGAGEGAGRVNIIPEEEAAE